MSDPTQNSAIDVQQLDVDTTLYGESALFRTCYKFTDRAYLFLKRKGPDRVVVEFRPKDANDVLGDVVGSFMNELIDQQIRSDLASESKAIREWVVAQAFIESDLPLPDPILGIAAGADGITNPGSEI